MTGFAIILTFNAVMANAAESAGVSARLVVMICVILIAILSVVMLFVFWAIIIGLSDLLIRRFRKARDLISRTASDLPLFSTIRTIS